MSREVEYNPKYVCDNCKKEGAFDFMGDYFCFDCLLIDKDGKVVGIRAFEE